MSAHSDKSSRHIRKKKGPGLRLLSLFVLIIVGYSFQVLLVQTISKVDKTQYSYVKISTAKHKDFVLCDIKLYREGFQA
ncbi:hypothetical protein HPP92_006355 [Vanilla planifolia]|uniref:Uncharacterized protein n=1 Tax=Vanilla planifolia TaxID=51239 RepID=A0A835RP24_VANPL|nr:hypothetical protein HPP92_006355 [Vanilla planifolia]